MSVRPEDLARNMRQLFDAGSGVGLTDRELLGRLAPRGKDTVAPVDSSAAEAAFETLLARHGTMVLSVCRQILGDVHAADDAFQATFLVLIRRSGSLGSREYNTLGPWLYGVAYRTAIQARRLTARRRARERRVAVPVVAGDTSPVELDDLRSLLHAEVSRLPAKYRAPIVLCYFEGRTHEEAAGALHWPAGTVRGRLARARDLLRSRLTRRGLGPAMAIGAAALERTAQAEVEAPLRDATIALSIKGAPARASVAALTNFVLRNLVMTRLKISAVAVLAIALLGTGAGVLVAHAPADRPPDRLDAPRPAVKEAQASTGLVDRFGDELPKGARARMGTLRFRHGDLVANALYTPEGRLVVSVGASGAVRVWNAATGRKLREIGDPATRFLGIGLSSDGNTLATIAHPGGLTLWDFATGREQRRWHETKNEFYEHLALSPDGQTVAASVYKFDDATKKEERFIKVWDRTARTERPRRFGGGWLSLSDLKFSSDSKMLATASDDTGSNVLGEKPEKSSLRLWDPATGKERKRFSVQGCRVQSVAFSPNGKLLAASVTDGSIRLYDLATGQERAPRLVVENPDGPRPQKAGGGLVPPPPDQRALGPVPARGPVGEARPTAMKCLTFSPDGSILAGGSIWPGNTGLSALAAVHLWDVAQGKELRRLPAHQGAINSLAFSPDGATLVTTGAELVVRLWDVATGNERLPQEGHRSLVRTLAISPADGTVFTAGQDGTVRRWDPLTGRDLGVFATFAEPVGAMAFTPDGKTLLLGTNTAPGLAIWSVTERREIRRLVRIEEAKNVRHAGFFFGTAYSADGKQMITVESEGVCIRDVATGNEVRWPVRSTIDSYHPALSPDGRILATGTEDADRRAGKLDRAIHLWELASGQEVSRLEGPDDGEGTSDLAYSSDGRFLVACCNRTDPTRPEIMIRIWDTALGREVRQLRGHMAPAWSAAFTGDGRSLISASADGTALVWDVSDLPGQPKADRLTAVAFKDRWAELASSEAPVAYRASWALSTPSAVPFLRDQLSGTAARAYRGGGITEGPVAPPAVLRVLRAIAALERVGTAEAQRVLDRLAHGDPAAIATNEAISALARLKNRKN
jgi:RNA polymerase sigma factor (sigma-70 family)